ncbi:MAG TPA: C10 family peptidase, partial [Chitinophagales bacterium]|nr:C10 family peptidase [Chitinophagales bacterium]
MKKIYALLAALLAMNLILPAKSVDKDYAMQVARNFYYQTTGRQVTFTLAYQYSTAQNVGRPSDGQPVYYVFNVEGEEGFVMVSAEDMVQPILGYSTTSKFYIENAPPRIQDWLNTYRQEIVYVKENMVNAPEEIKTQWEDYYSNVRPQNASRAQRSVTPLLQTTWNQAPYYNTQCPYDANRGANCVTGCVATAMAQILKYWNYPSQGAGYHSYNDQNYGNQSANYGASTYNWASMPNSISSNNTEIAKLMYHCGVAVNMNYGVDESAAWVIIQDALGSQGDSSCAEYAYKKYFGYDPSTVKGMRRSGYNDQTWSDMLKNELDNSRPVQYVGSGSGGGHTWVCDGYDANSNFHMNWGWGGIDDGYFSLNSLAPSTLGIGGGTGNFNSNQEMVIGIKPLNNNGGGGNTVNQDSIFLYSNITVSANPATMYQQFTVSVDIANAGAGAFNGELAAALFNSDGVFNGFVNVLQNQTLNSLYYNTYNFTLDSLNVIPGTYYIGIYYKNGDNDYSLVKPGSYNNPVTVLVTSPYSNIQMYSADTITPLQPQVNQAFSVHVDIANAGNTNFSGYLLAALYDLEGNYITTIDEVSGTMQAQTYYNISFNSSGLNVDPGTYYIAFWSSTDENNWNLIYNLYADNPVEVTIVSQPISPDQYEQDNTAATAYNLPVNFSGNTAIVSTPGSNMHIGTDYDYYKVVLPSGTNYSIDARVNDSYGSDDGNTYNNDVVLSYQVNGGAWSDAYDPILPGPIFVQGGGTVVFFISDYFLGTVGNYLFKATITSGVSGINDTQLQGITVYPNPAANTLYINTGEAKGGYTLN